MVAEQPSIAELAERVARIEQRLDRADAGEPAPIPTDGDRFWALEGLQHRAGGASQVLYTGDVRLPTGEHAVWQQGFDTDALLAADWAHGADVLAALGHPVRLLLLRAVLCGTRTVQALGQIDSVGTTGQIYHHLRQLVAAGWLHSSGRGRYEVPASRVVPLLVVIAAAQP